MNANSVRTYVGVAILLVALVQVIAWFAERGDARRDRRLKLIHGAKCDCVSCYARRNRELWAKRGAS